MGGAVPGGVNYPTDRDQTKLKMVVMGGNGVPEAPLALLQNRYEEIGRIDDQGERVAEYAEIIHDPLGQVRILGGENWGMPNEAGENMCWLNAALQLLAASDKLIISLSKIEERLPGNLRALYRLLFLLRQTTNGESLEKRNSKLQVQLPSLVNHMRALLNCKEGSQQDACEFLHILINNLVEVNPSNLFGVLRESRMYCPACPWIQTVNGNGGIEFGEHAKQLALAVPKGDNKKLNMQDLLNKEMLSNQHAERSRYPTTTCPNPNHQMQQCTAITAMNNVVVVRLQRWDAKTGRRNNAMVYPSKLINLKTHQHVPGTVNFEYTSENVYELKSTISHVGESQYQGHFIAHTIHEHSTTCYDDGKVQKLNVEQTFNKTYQRQVVCALYEKIETKPITCTAPPASARANDGLAPASKPSNGTNLANFEIWICRILEF